MPIPWAQSGWMPALRRSLVGVVRGYNAERCCREFRHEYPFLDGITRFDDVHARLERTFGPEYPVATRIIVPFWRLGYGDAGGISLGPWGDVGLTWSWLGVRHRLNAWGRDLVRSSTADIPVSRL